MLGWGFIIIKMVVVKDKNFKIISTSKKIRRIKKRGNKRKEVKKERRFNENDY
ncbi:hypothetical protein X927_00500 [Petrotoga mexicana DSM 14811]|jgi:hypothetical protein|uniref:Uncharacterized protein n=1 Tax=Petrotoga mexicana DSM 14811 TaxID=1122954 RepID=A0A2K1PFM5_9BACT|nr:hypothetical protein [Petrotoga mexicana]PNS01578.1 hypothetical protein X927_00500 [Petrotoga mexicana DSM 14811]